MMFWSVRGTEESSGQGDVLQWHVFSRIAKLTDATGNLVSVKNGTTNAPHWTGSGKDIHHDENGLSKYDLYGLFFWYAVNPIIK